MLRSSLTTVWHYNISYATDVSSGTVDAGELLRVGAENFGSAFDESLEPANTAVTHQRVV